MANRVMAQKERKRRNYIKKVFPKRYGSDMVKVSQGPDLRVSEYYQRAKGLGKELPITRVKFDNTTLERELKKLFQTDRMQKIHEYYNLYVPGQERRSIKYYFGGGEHFFVQELPAHGIRRRSVIYNSKEQAMIYYNNNSIRWDVTQVISAQP